MRLGWVPRGDTAVPLATSQRSLGCVSGECWGLCPPSTGLAPGLWRGTQEHLGRESLMPGACVLGACLRSLLLRGVPSSWDQRCTQAWPTGCGSNGLGLSSSQAPGSRRFY